MNVLPILLLGGAAALIMTGKKKSKPEDGPNDPPDVTDEQAGFDEVLANFQKALKKTEPMALVTRLAILDDWVIASVDPPAKNGPYVGVLGTDSGFRTTWGLSVTDIKNKIKAGK
jgi:hypothetical protein